MPDINDLNNDVVSGVDVAPKKSGAKVAAITAGALAVVAGGGFAAYNMSDYVKNQVKLTVSKPASYYAWVNEENTNEYAKKAADKYRLAIEKAKNGQTSSCSVKYETSQEVKDLVVNLLYGSSSKKSEEDNAIIDVINNIDSIKIGAEAGVKKSSVQGNTFAELNDQRLMTFDFAYSDIVSEDMTIFFRIPELTEKWFGASYSDISDEVAADEEEELAMKAYKAFMEDPEAFLSPEDFENEVKRYMGVWNASIEDVQLEKKQEVTIGEITTEYTVLTVEIDQAKAKQIAENFINEAKNDSVIKGIVVDKLEAMTEDEYNAQLDEILEEMDSETDSDTVLTLTTYVDPKGDIRGFAFDVPDDASFSYIIGKENDQLRGIMTMSEDGEEKAHAEISATETDGVYNGSADITITETSYDWETEEDVSEQKTASLTFTDVKVENDTLGYLSGNFVLTIEDMDAITINCASDGASQSISYPIIIDEKDYGTVTVSFSVNDGADPAIPEKSDAIMVDSDFDEEDFAEYVSEDEMEKFINELMTKVGFSEEYAEEIAKSAVNSLYSNYDYDDYDDYDFDEKDFEEWDG